MSGEAICRQCGAPRRCHSDAGPEAWEGALLCPVPGGYAVSPLWFDEPAYAVHGGIPCSGPPGCEICNSIGSVG